MPTKKNIKGKFSIFIFNEHKSFFFSKYTEETTKNLKWLQPYNIFNLCSEFIFDL